MEKETAGSIRFSYAKHKKKSGSPISREVADTLILNAFPSFTLESLKKISSRQYVVLLEQSVNIKNSMWGKLELQTDRDKKITGEEEYTEMIKEGRM